MADPFIMVDAPRLSLNYTPTSAPGAPHSPPLVVLVHGGAISSRMYRTTTPLLHARGFDTAAPDLPGHGSSKPLGPFSFAASSTLIAGALRAHRAARPGQRIVIVGVSLGGQAVLDLLQREPGAADAAVVSGVSMGPPDERAGWAMPKMPGEGDEWLTVIGEDVAIMGMENAQGIQDASFAWTFEAPSENRAENGAAFPPTLVLVGEEDTPMSRRDFDEVVKRVKAANPKSEGNVLKGAWHNHPIDVPELFVDAIVDWIAQVSVGWK